MKRAIRILGIIAAAMAITATADAGQFILRARSTADAETLCLRYGMTDVRTVHTDTTQDICIVTADTGSAAGDAALKAQVSADPLALAFELDTSQQLAETSVATTSSTSAAQTTGAAGGLAQSTAAILEAFAGQPAISYFGNLVSGAYVNQPAAAVINLARARPLATGGGVVAIIDTGVDPGHQMLAGALVPGYDFVHGVAGIPTDFAEISQSTAAILEQLQAAAPNSVAQLNQSTAAILEQSTAAILESSQLPAAFGHGTMIAGLVHLVAPTAPIMPLKAFTADGDAKLSDLISAIYYAVDNGASVINMSFTLATPSRSMLDAVVYAAAHGVLCVAAAGNDGVQKDTYPAAWPGVIDVASTTNTDERSLFSNWSSRVDMSAPGEALITAYPGNHYAAAWGTSFSTALVTGSVALVQQYVPRISEPDILKLLEDGAVVPSGMGKARLDLYQAITEMIHDYLR
jgi:hypothetical protein